MELLTVAIPLRVNQLRCSCRQFSVVVPAAALSAAQSPQREKNNRRQEIIIRSNVDCCVDEGTVITFWLTIRFNPMANLRRTAFQRKVRQTHGSQGDCPRTSNSGSARPLFKVRSVATVSETCAPTTQTDKK
jgi:hypothetical protein